MVGTTRGNGARTKSMRVLELLVLCPIAMQLAGCGAGGAATSSTPQGVPAPPQASRPPTAGAQRNDHRATPTDETFDQLERGYQDASILERHLGTASYYASSLNGHRMANGLAYDPSRPTMAHRTLPFGTIVRVVRLATGAAVVVRVTDRGPFGKRRRIADLSREAARRLDMTRDGVVDVRLEVLRRSR